MPYDYESASFAAVCASLAGDTHGLDYIFQHAPDQRRLYVNVADWCASKVAHDFAGDRARALDHIAVTVPVAA